MAYANIEPFGPLREDLRALAIALLVLNAWRDKGQPAVKAKSFFPHLFRQPSARAVLASLPGRKELQAKLLDMSAALAGIGKKG